MQTQTPQPNNPTPTIIPALYIVIPAEAGIHPSGTITHNPAIHPIPSLLPSIELEAEGSPADATAAILRSIISGSEPESIPPSPQYQTRGKRLRQGAGASLCSSLPLSLKGPKSLPRVPRGGEGDQGGEGSLPAPAPREISRNPFRRHSIKTATSSINVQSTFNQNLSPPNLPSRWHRLNPLPGAERPIIP